MTTNTLRTHLNCLLGLASFFILISMSCGISIAAAQEMNASATTTEVVYSQDVIGATTSILASTSRTTSPSCVFIQKNVAVESVDAKGASDTTVADLQAFLAAQKYLRVRPTGYFGPLTLNAVKNFQKEHGILTTGFVGPLTRNAIKSITCGTDLGFIGPRLTMATLDAASSTAGTMATSTATVATTTIASATTSTPSIVLGGGGGGYVASVATTLSGGNATTSDVDPNYTPETNILSAIEAWIRANPRTFINPPVGTETDMDLNSDNRVDLADGMIMRSIHSKPDDIFVGVYRKIMHAVALREGVVAGDAQFLTCFDANKDGIIDATDYVRISKALIATRAFTPPLTISPLPNKVIVTTNGDTAPSQNIAIGVTDQLLGGFEINNTGTDIVVIKKIVLDLNVSAGAGTKTDITTIGIYDENGVIVAGPVDVRADGSANDGKIVFTDPIYVRYAATSKFTVKGAISRTMGENQTVTLSFAEMEWPKGAHTDMVYIVPSVAGMTMKTMTIKGAHVTISSRVGGGGYMVDAGKAGVDVASIMFDARDSAEDIRVSGIPAWRYVYDGIAGDEISVCQVFYGNTLLVNESHIVYPVAGANGAPYAFTFDTPLIVKKGSALLIDLKCDVSPLVPETATLHWDIDSAAVASLPLTALGSGNPVIASGEAIGPTIMFNNPLLRATAPAAPTAPTTPTAPTDAAVDATTTSPSTPAVE